MCSTHQAEAEGVALFIQQSDDFIAFINRVITLLLGLSQNLTMDSVTTFFKLS
jgi:hypothetical protein